MNRQQIYVFSALSALILLLAGIAAIKLPASDGQQRFRAPGPTQAALSQISVRSTALTATPTTGETTVGDLENADPLAPDSVAANGATSTVTGPAGQDQSGKTYTVLPGDTLLSIAVRFNTTTETLARLNDLSDPNRLAVGQKLRLPGQDATVQIGPAEKLLPDSELVYGPAFVSFDVTATVHAHAGYVDTYIERVENKQRTGAEIVQMVAQRYSVGPRLLLALLENRAGWVTNPNPLESSQTYPLGKVQPGYENLFQQLSWAANELNAGYYGYKGRGLRSVTLTDGNQVKLAAGLNPGTAGLQYLLSLTSDQNAFSAQLGPAGVMKTYQDLWGDPFQYARTVIPPGLRQPELKLPFAPGQTWYFTGGPHGGWGEGSAFAAIDFAPGIPGCEANPNFWDVAAAPGTILRADNGEVIEELDSDGYEQTGWVLLYMHVADEDRIQPGAHVQRGQPIGHPSCQGGISNAAHLHFARRFNGEWIPADSRVPMVLSGWQVHSTSEYNGTLTRGNEVKTADDGKSLANEVESDNRP